MSPSQPELPGAQWLLWLRNATLRLGVLCGLYLSIMLTAWLFFANRVAWAANFSTIHKPVAAALMGLAALIPVMRYLKAPVRLFTAGIISWAVLSLAYMGLGLYFHRLHTRMGTFHLFMLGAIAYGVAAVVAWVAALVFAAREHPLGVSRRRSL